MTKYRLQKQTVFIFKLWLLENYISVAVFGVDVGEVCSAYTVSALAGEGTEPDKVVLLYHCPVVSQVVAAFTFEDVSAVLLNMCLDEGMASAGSKGENVEVHVEVDVDGEKILDEYILHVVVDAEGNVFRMCSMAGWLAMMEAMCVQAGTPLVLRAW